jgi:hypothetical protein
VSHLGDCADARARIIACVSWLAVNKQPSHPRKIVSMNQLNTLVALSDFVSIIQSG